MRKSLVLFLTFSFALTVQAQDSTYVRHIIKTLSSETYFGRGYTKQGVNLAADFLEKEMKSIGLKPLKDSYKQELSYPVNVFPGAYTLKIDDKLFYPSKDFILSPDCGKIEGEFQLVEISHKTLKDSAKLCNLNPKKFTNKFVVFHLHILDNRKYKSFIKKRISENFLHARGYIIVQDYYPIWSIRSTDKDFAVIRFQTDKFPSKAKSMYLNIDKESITANTSNIIGHYNANSDKTIVLSAHYDHLGGIGDSIYFPGAQDNASGVAACLDIARHHIKHELEYNLVVMLFTGEEAGLLGSTYYSLNPLFPLEDIDFLINLDMVGTGSKGITIVNAKDSTYQKELELFEGINEKEKLEIDIKARGISANSDHHPFNAQGVKGIFIYSRGGNTYYHNIEDKEETVTLSAYNEIFQLITKFAEAL